MLSKLNKIRTWQASFIIALFGFGFYFDGLKNQFIGDDNSQIVGNLPVHSISHIALLFKGGTFYIGNGLAPLYGNYYRPLMSTVYSLIYTLFGPHPFYFHLVQLLLCIGSTTLLFLFFKNSFSPVLSLLLSLIFLVHPIDSQTVFEISALQDALFFFFGILALYLLIRLHSLKSLILVALSLFLSALAKETAILFVIMALLYLFWWDRKILYYFMSIMFIPIICYIALRLHAIGLFRHPTIAPIDNASLGVRLLTAPSIILFYFSRLIFPWNLASAYYWVDSRFSVIHVLLPLLADIAILGLFIFLGFIVRENRSKAEFYTYLFFMLWCMIGLAMTTQVVALDMTASETWFYFPMVGILGMIGIISRLLPSKLRFNRILLFSLVLVVAVLGLRTAIRGLDWQSAVTLAAKDITASKNDYNAYDTLASEQIADGNLNKAQHLAQQSISIYPTLNNYDLLGQILSKQRKYAEAVSVYDLGLQYGANTSTYDKLAELTLVYGGYADGVQYFSGVLQQYPNNPTLLMYFALFEARWDDNSQAKIAIGRAAAYGQVPEIFYNHIMNDQPFTVSLPDLSVENMAINY